MYTFLRFGVGILGGGIGALLGVWLLKRNDIPHNPFIEFIFIMGGAVVVGLLAGYIYGLYVLYFSGNMEHVQNLVNRMKNPLYVITRLLIRDENDKVWNLLNKINNPSLRAYIESQLLLEERNVEKAEKVIETIKLKKLRDIQLATLALVKGDWERFNQLRNNLKPVFKYSMAVEEAFKKGDFDKAKHFGDLAIANAKGLQRYIFIKNLERQQNNPKRSSYF